MENNVKLTPNRFFKTLCIYIHLGLFSYTYAWVAQSNGITYVLTWAVFFGLLVTSILPTLLLATTKEPGSKKKNILTTLVFLLTFVVNSSAHFLVLVITATAYNPFWQLFTLDIVNLLSFFGYLITKMFASTKEAPEPSRKQKWKSFLYLLIFCLAAVALALIDQR